MAGRVAAVSGRPVFDLVRERLGPRVGAGEPVGVVPHHAADADGRDRRRRARAAAGSAASTTCCGSRSSAFARVAGDLAGEVRDAGERSSACSAWRWSCFVRRAVPAGSRLGRSSGSQATHFRPPERRRAAPTYFYYAIALFGAAMTPYEVFFFSSGGGRGALDPTDLTINRANVFIGFPLGGLLSLALMAASALVLPPRRHRRRPPRQVALPVGMALGKVGLALVIVGVLRRHVRRRAGDRACRPATRSPSTSAGSGASSCARGRRPASTSSCWSASCSAIAVAADRRSTRSRSPSTRSCSPPSPCR